MDTEPCRQLCPLLEVLGMIPVREWRKLQVSGDQRVRDRSPVPHDVDYLAVGEGGGQEACLGHQERFLVTDNFCWLSMSRYDLQKEGCHGLDNELSISQKYKSNQNVFNLNFKSIC